MMRLNWSLSRVHTPGIIIIIIIIFLFNIDIKSKVKNYNEKNKLKEILPLKIDYNI